ADPLMDGSIQYQLSKGNSALQATILKNTLANCRTAAKQYAALNSAGAVNSLVLKDSDIQFGFTDKTGKYTAGTSAFPKTVKVTMRLDDQANGSLGLFFARVVGTTTTNLNATASATIYTGLIDGLSPNYPTGLLPVTYDVNGWNNFLATGKGNDDTV